MNLPFVLDIAIGLVFIYLILSLLASELQELITTLLQWRAKHLKDSIELLLSGGSGTKESDNVQDLVSQIYNDPLLKNVNQGTKGFVSVGFRKLSQLLFSGNRVGAFGVKQSSGPSYIAAETFATSLLERLGLSTLTTKLIEVRLEKFQTRIIGKYNVDQNGIVIPENDDPIFKSSFDKGGIRTFAEKAGKQDLNRDNNFRDLVEEYDDVLQDFKTGQATLKTCLERMGESFKSFISAYPEPNLQSNISENITPYTPEPYTPGLYTPGPYTPEPYTPGPYSPGPDTLDPYTPGAYPGPYTPDTYTPSGQASDSPIEGVNAVSDQPDQPMSIGTDMVYFLRRLNSMRVNLFGENNERAIVSGGLQPSLPEIAELVDEASNTYQEVKASYEAIAVQGKAIKQAVEAKATELLKKDDPDNTLNALDNDTRRRYIMQAMTNLQLQPQDRSLYEKFETYVRIQAVLAKLPTPVKESFAVLARRAQTRVQQTSQGVGQVATEFSQFGQEVALWFDRSMSRTSGVYKRNAKGVAILIGVFLASITNSDSFYIVNRLSSDENLRQVITEQAVKLESKRTSPDDPASLQKLKDQTDEALKDIALPIGWKSSNVVGQFDCPPASQTGLSTPFAESCSNTRKVLNPSQVFQLIFSNPIKFFKIVLGWLLTGIAISMGASFWFDLLGKIVNVRNSGSKPASPTVPEQK